ncbi:MAG: sugar epimerase [Bacteriovoracaceae bacterium]|jgi:dTDP-4-dehydrorhamnose 3,5-epimerase-like enzyme|nr:sugar epimerase [Bacteriovoracaceae bacterium]
MELPKQLKGGLAVDDRGQVGFVNDFDFASVKRFYTVENHDRGFVRAWHAHKNESKYVMAVSGAAVIGAVKIDDWDNPSKELETHRFTLSANTPSVLYIPNGYANGFMSLTDDTKLMFFSSSKLDDSLGDDYRFDARLWDVWNIDER